MLRLYRVLIATALMWCLSAPSSVSAHMGVDTSTPGNAESLVEAPDEAVITFNADVDITTATGMLRYIGDANAPIADAVRRDVRTEQLSITSAQDRTVVFDLPELDAGMYALDWSVNEAGGHSNASFILFIITGPSNETAPLRALLPLVLIGVCIIISVGFVAYAGRP